MKNFTYTKNVEYENQTSRSMNTENQEVCKSNLLKYENQTSGSMEIIHQEVCNSYANDNNINNTKDNYTDINKTILSYPIDEDSMSPPASA